MKETKKAFTIVEISLAMTFLAVLMVSIATLIMRITGIYQKGLTLRAINSAGTEIIEDMTRTVGAASYLVDINSSDLQSNGSLDYTKSNEAIENYYFAKSVPRSYVIDGKNKTVNSQKYGIFCTGTYSYVWNTADVLRQDYFHGLSVKIKNGATYHPKFAKIYDTEQHYCRDKNESVMKQSVNSNDAVITLEDDSYYTDLLGDDELDIAMYEFNVVPITQSTVTKQSFVSANFIVATKNGGVNINSNGDFCRGKGNEYSEEYSNADFNYCAVNKFSFSVRTGGNSVKEG